MADSSSPFLAQSVGPPQFERYVIRRNFFEPQEFYTGRAGEGWSIDLGKARLYVTIDDLGHDLHDLAIRELAHLPQVNYRLEVDVTAIGEATPEQVREYLSGALTIGLDYENHGPGPGLGTLVLVKTDTEALKAEDDLRAWP
jgi:hypothetical protein